MPTITMSRPSAARRSFRITAFASPRSFTKRGRASRPGSPSGARPTTIPQGASRPTSSPRNRSSATLAAETEWRRDAFASVYRDEHFAHLVDLPDDQAGIEFGARLFADPTTQYFRVFEVMRDYGMYERTEAPQYYPPINREQA